MTSCNVDQDDHRNNGLITKIWGGAAWTFLHSITFGYPINPSDEQKSYYKQFFISIGNVLPCRFCRESYKKFITTGETKLTDDVLSCRETLTKWLYAVHEAVNNKLEISYGITYDDVVNRYESFRARCNMSDPVIKGCITPLDYKAFSYRKLAHMDCPIVNLELISPFIKLAKIRELDKKYFIFLELIYKYHGDITLLKKHETWNERNIFCQKQIKYMRESAIPSIEKSGIWKNTPSIEELKLMLFMCSNLNRTEIKDCIIQLSKNSHYLSQIDTIYQKN